MKNAKRNIQLWDDNVLRNFLKLWYWYLNDLIWIMKHFRSLKLMTFANFLSNLIWSHTQRKGYRNWTRKMRNKNLIKKLSITQTNTNTSWEELLSIQELLKEDIIILTFKTEKPLNGISLMTNSSLILKSQKSQMNVSAEKKNGEHMETSEEEFIRSLEMVT